MCFSVIAKYHNTENRQTRHLYVVLLIAQLIRDKFCNLEVIMRLPDAILCFAVMENSVNFLRILAATRINAKIWKLFKCTDHIFCIFADMETANIIIR